MQSTEGKGPKPNELAMTIGNEMIENLRHNVGEERKRREASSSQSAAPTNSDASDWCKNDRHEMCMYFSCKCKCHSGVDQSAPEPPSQPRTFQQADCPKCHQRITVEVLGLGGGSTGERAEPSRERWVFWVEPFGPRDEPVYMYVPETTAVHTQRNTAWKAKKYRYVSDRHALEDFMTVNWASFVDKPKEIK